MDDSLTRIEEACRTLVRRGYIVGDLYVRFRIPNRHPGEFYCPFDIGSCARINRSDLHKCPTEEAVIDLVKARLVTAFRNIQNFAQDQIQRLEETE